MEYVRAVGSLFSSSSRKVKGVTEAQNGADDGELVTGAADAIGAFVYGELGIVGVTGQLITGELFVTTGELVTGAGLIVGADVGNLVTGDELIDGVTGELITGELGGTTGDDQHVVADLEWVPSTGYTFDDVKEFDDILNMLTLYANQTVAPFSISNGLSVREIQRSKNYARRAKNYY